MEKNQYNLIEQYTKKYAEAYAKKIDDSIFALITNVKPHKVTPAEKRQAELREKKEKIRRAKKMTLTVGEYEDLIEGSCY